MTTTIQIGDVVRCVNAAPLSKTKVGPPLVLSKTYKVRNKLTVDGHDHLDVGLMMEINFVRCLETDVILAEQPQEANKPIHPHWCHPSRFVKVY